MHISEGILSPEVLIAGAVIAIAGTGIGLKKMDYDKMPRVAILSSVFFIGSLIHVPIGPSSVHLILNGLIGIILGWMSFPAILVALTLQSILFQFGGLTVLGINTVNMASPGVIVYFIFNRLIKNKKRIISMIASFSAGTLAVFISAVFTAFSLFFTGEFFIQVAKLMVIAHFPIMVIEGLITLFIVTFLKKVKPEILEVPYACAENS